jgi:hypothetical protein
MNPRLDLSGIQSIRIAFSIAFSDKRAKQVHCIIPFSNLETFPNTFIVVIRASHNVITGTVHTQSNSLLVIVDRCTIEIAACVSVSGQIIVGSYELRLFIHLLLHKMQREASQCGMLLALVD